MHIEVKCRTGRTVADEWGHNPNLRAEIKSDIAAAMARVLRTHDLIKWETSTNGAGDFVVRGFLKADPGDKDLVSHVVDLNPEPK